MHPIDLGGQQGGGGRDKSCCWLRDVSEWLICPSFLGDESTLRVGCDDPAEILVGVLDGEGMLRIGGAQAVHWVVRCWYLHRHGRRQLLRGLLGGSGGLA